jgi:hypothetical protein
LEGALPAITTENMNDLFLLSEKFGFVSLQSQVTEYISAHSIVDYEARKRVSDLEAKNRQQARKYCLLQKEVVDLREANKVQMQDIAEIREGRAREAAELSHLAGEIASLAQASRLQQQEIVDLREANKAQKEEIGALGGAQAKSDNEVSELRAQFGREQEATKREIAALERRLGEETAARGKFAQELESLKAQFAKEQTKWDEASKQNMREHESLRKQNAAPPPAAQEKPAPASPAEPAPPPKPPAAPQTQFPFASDPPEQGKMPAGGLIAHLTAKCGGNVHDKGAVEITASSVDHDIYAPRNTADLGTGSYFYSKDKPRQRIW